MRSLVLAAAMCGTLVVPATAATFTGFVGFSDSFNDEGRIIGGLNFPSFGDRFSDGPVWFEQVGERFESRGLTDINLSLGGATAGPQFDDPTDPTDNVDLYTAFDALAPVPPGSIPLTNLQDFNSQIDTYLALDADVGDHPLYAISLGGNDVLQRGLAVGIPQAVEAIFLGVSRLILEDPAATQTFLISNFIDPLVTLDLNPARAAELTVASGLVAQVNDALALSLASLPLPPNVTIEIFDMFSVFNEIVEEARLAGLTTDRTCIDGFVNASLLLSPVPVPGPTECSEGDPPSSFLFGDPVHPLSFAHDRLAAATIEQLDDRLPPIPVPAGLPLMAGALGLLLVARRLKATGLST